MRHTIMTVSSYPMGMTTTGSKKTCPTGTPAARRTKTSSGSRLLLGVSLIGCALAMMQPSAAWAEQLPKREGLLMWRGDDQVAGYRNIDQIFSTRTVARGATVRELPVAQQPINPNYSFGQETGSVDEYMARNRTAALLVIKDGQIVLEKYALGQTADDRWISFSITKSLVATLLGAAITDGDIESVNDPVTKYIPELVGSAYDGVTLQQILTMRSGVAWNEDYADPKSDVGQLAASMAQDKGTSLIDTMVKLPRAVEPGTLFHYNTGETNMMGIIVSRATGKVLSDYLSEKIWAPYGMEADAAWLTDGGTEVAGCCLNMTLRDYGRVALFSMGGGEIDGKAVIPATWMAEATTSYSDDAFPHHVIKNAGYGYQWWVHGEGEYEAIGIMGQSIFIDPVSKLVVVESSAWPSAHDQEYSDRQQAFRAAIVAALPSS